MSIAYCDIAFFEFWKFIENSKGTLYSLTYLILYGHYVYEGPAG